MFTALLDKARSFARATDPAAPYTPVGERRPARPAASIEGRRDPYTTLEQSVYRPGQHMGTSSARLVVRDYEDPVPTDFGEPRRRAQIVPEYLADAFARWDRTVQAKARRMGEWIENAFAPPDRPVQETPTFRRRAAQNRREAVVDVAHLYRPDVDTRQLAHAIFARARHASDLAEETGLLPPAHLYVTDGDYQDADDRAYAGG